MQANEAENLHPEDERWMREAMELAREAYAAGEVPIGALVIAAEGVVIGRGSNHVERRKDALAHAELLAITEAQRVLGDWRLNECTLVVTKEPCPMCAGALANARTRRVVFGVGDTRWGGGGGAVDLLRFPGNNHHCEVRAHVLEEENRELLQRFFREAREGKLRKPGALS